MRNQEYHVTWDIEVTAHSPRGAAKEALKIQRDLASRATVFTVSYHDVHKTKSGKTKSAYKNVKIDLE